MDWMAFRATLMTTSRIALQSIETGGTRGFKFRQSSIFLLRHRPERKSAASPMSPLMSAGSGCIRRGWARLSNSPMTLSIRPISSMDFARSRRCGWSGSRPSLTSSIVAAIPIRGLRISWEMPAASCPTAASFPIRWICSPMRFFSVWSLKKYRVPASRPWSSFSGDTVTSTEICRPPRPAARYSFVPLTGSRSRSSKTRKPGWPRRAASTRSPRIPPASTPRMRAASPLTAVIVPLRSRVRMPLGELSRMLLLRLRSATSCSWKRLFSMMMLAWLAKMVKASISDFEIGAASRDRLTPMQPMIAPFTVSGAYTMLPRRSFSVSRRSMGVARGSSSESAK